MLQCGRKTCKVFTDCVLCLCRKVAVASGANMDFDRLRFVSERADSREKLLSVQLPERPGSFLDLYQAVYPRNVTELSYRITAAAAQEGLPWANGQHQGYTGSTKPQAAHVYISYQSRGGSVAAQDEDAREVKADLVASGLEPTDLTDNEMAKAHARYLAGGRAPNVQCERLHRFRAQPRVACCSACCLWLTQRFVCRIPGAVRRAGPVRSNATISALNTRQLFEADQCWRMHRFLKQMGEAAPDEHYWNVSLFHYRNHGADIGSPKRSLAFAEACCATFCPHQRFWGQG